MVHDQNNFSKSYNQMYLEETRVLKANKALAVIHDFLGPTSEMYLLDIGCSTGIMTNQYAKKFKNTVGIDIDTSGIKFAKESFENKNLNFYNCSHEDIMLGNEKFDVVICTHIYEHVKIYPGDLTSEQLAHIENEADFYALRFIENYNYDKDEIIRFISDTTLNREYSRTRIDILCGNVSIVEENIDLIRF